MRNPADLRAGSFSGETTKHHRAVQLLQSRGTLVDVWVGSQNAASHPSPCSTWAPRREETGNSSGSPSSICRYVLNTPRVSEHHDD